MLLLSTILPGMVTAETAFEGLRTRIEQGYRDQDLASIEAARGQIS